MHLSNQTRDNEIITSALEIVDNELWFPNYSKYRTSWCLMLLSLLVFNPEFNEIEINIDKLYSKALVIWELHHLNNAKLGLPVPEPPTLAQMQDAVNYFIIKNMVISKVTDPVKSIKEYREAKKTKLVKKENRSLLDRILLLLK
jgi:hypothetical protein